MDGGRGNRLVPAKYVIATVKRIDLSKKRKKKKTGGKKKRASDKKVKVRLVII